MTFMNNHPTVFAAFRLSTKTYLRQEPIARPIAHVTSCIALLFCAAVASFAIGNQLDRAAADKTASLMATFAVPSPYYGAKLRMPELADVEDGAAEDEVEVSAR